MHTADLDALLLSEPSGRKTFARGRLSRRGKLLVACGFGLAVTAIAAFFALGRSERQRPPQQQQNEDKAQLPEKPVSEEITLALEGLPPNARVTLDGAPVVPPITGTRSGASRRLSIVASGYETLDLTVVFDQNRSIAVDMRKEADTATDGTGAERANDPLGGVEKKSGSKRDKKRKKAGWEENPF